MRSRFHIYCDILATGLLNIRAAAYEGDAEQCHAEADHLHNVPSHLKDMEHDGLHRFYWEAMRAGYLRVSKPKWAASYEQLWKELEAANDAAATVNPKQ